MSKKIPLTKGKYAIVDDEDFEWLNQWKWMYHIKGYASRTLNHIMMHRVVTNCPPGMEVDHINHNRLDNRRCNLRVCTPAQNASNKSKARINTSGYTGVYWRASREVWEVMIFVNRQRIYLGSSKDKHEAARMYNVAALEYRGEFARINEIEI